MGLQHHPLCYPRQNGLSLPVVLGLPLEEVGEGHESPAVLGAVAQHLTGGVSGAACRSLLPESALELCSQRISQGVALSIRKVYLRILRALLAIAWNPRFRPRLPLPASRAPSESPRRPCRLWSVPLGVWGVLCVRSPAGAPDTPAQQTSPKLFTLQGQAAGVGGGCAGRGKTCPHPCSFLDDSISYMFCLSLSPSLFSASPFCSVPLFCVMIWRDSQTSPASRHFVPLRRLLALVRVL